jgi:DNA polymerase-3 subunit delta
MKIKEDILSADIKAGKLGNLYFIYGKEPMLISMYADRIVEKSVGADADDFNLQRLSDVPDPDMLTDFVEALPVFADRKTVLVKDFDPEKCDADTAKRYLDIVSDVPETTILVFYSPDLDIEEKGMKAKTRKFLDAVDKYGIRCAVEQMKPPKIAELCVKKAAKEGIVISPDDALFLAERTGGQMMSASDEMSKLMSYVGKGGKITRAEIETLVPRQLTAGIFELADAVNRGRHAEAFRIIDELFLQQQEAVSIMGALSSAFLDMYCARLAKSDGISGQAAAPMFGCFGGKAWVFANKIYPAAANLDLGYLRKSVEVLSEADIKLKSSPVDPQTVIEESVVRIFGLRKGAAQ